MGSHCAVNFIEAGQDIVIIDNLETSYIETVNALKKIGHVEFVKGDLRNSDEIDEVFKMFEIDAVMHFAGSNQINESIISPSKYYKNNVVGTLNLLDAMLKYGIKKMVYSSTCETYGEPLYLPVDEIHPQIPQNAYGRSKSIVEKILDDYDNAYGIKSVKLRHYNVIGGYNQKLLSYEQEAGSDNRSNISKSVLYDFKDLNIVDFVDVEDIASAYHLAYLYLKNENTSNAFNIGAEQKESKKDIFDVWQKVFSKKMNVTFEKYTKTHVAQSRVNIKKAKKFLGWSPEKTLEQSLKSLLTQEKQLQNFAKNTAANKV